MDAFGLPLQQRWGESRSAASPALIATRVFYLLGGGVGWDVSSRAEVHDKHKIVSFGVYFTVYVQVKVAHL